METFTDSRSKTNKLVFSDEFDSSDRDFANGNDARWTALEIGDTSNKGAAFYLPSQATVVNDPRYPKVSALQILTENASHTGDSPTGEKGIFMPFRSAMLQSWNKVRRRESSRHAQPGAQRRASAPQCVLSVARD